MTESTGHAALLLAAGGSRRLGRPKQLLMRDGQPLVRRMAELALATQPSRLVAVLGAHAQRVAEALAGLPLTTVTNADWSTGLASSLCTGTRALMGDTGAVLVLGIDQPALDGDHLRALLAAFDGRRDVASGYAGVTGTPAVLRAGTLARIDELDGDRGFGGFWRQPGALVQVIANEPLAFDLDTADDLAHARAVGWIDPD